MKLNGVLSKIMDNYICLRGVANIKKLAEISEVNPDIQRNLIEEHRDEMKDYLERGEYSFFPEVILSMSMDLPSECNDYTKFAAAVDSAFSGFNSKVGNLRINFKSDKSRLVDERKQLKVAQITYDENKIRLSRIDGNHRLSAAQSLSKDVLVPFCLIFFSNKDELDANSRAIFHNINSKQIPINMEQNIKIIIESQKVFSDKILENPQPFGLHYKLTRSLLIGGISIDFTLFPNIYRLVDPSKYSFFVTLFRLLLKDGLISEITAVDEVRKKLIAIESSLNNSQVIINKDNVSLVGALAYYKFSNNEKYDRFVKWIERNHIADAKSFGIDDIINIFDKVYDSIPKRIFLARWYPSQTHPDFNKAQLRLKAIQDVSKELNLELIDLGTKGGATYDIRSCIFNEIKQSDIFIADLTGCRHNVMVEVGYALRSGENRMLFFFSPTEEYENPPFDLDGFRYEKISDSAEINLKVKPMIKEILEEIS